MKDIVKFIKESVSVYRLNKVVAKYLVQPSELIFQAPETYSESDIQIYIGDKYLNEMPSYTEYAYNFFGINADNIIDAHFEYDTFSHVDVEPKDYIKWDSKYDLKVYKDIKLEYFKLSNIKYIIEFDRFDMENVTDDDVKDKLIDIFKSPESNNANKWPLEIKFNEDSLEFIK